MNPTGARPLTLESLEAAWKRMQRAPVECGTTERPHVLGYRDAQRIRQGRLRGVACCHACRGGFTVDERTGRVVNLPGVIW